MAPKPILAEHSAGRRNILRLAKTGIQGAAAVAALSVAPGIISSALATPAIPAGKRPTIDPKPVWQGKDESRLLRVVNIHTREKAEVVYWHNGEYLEDGLAKLSNIMRDFRANEIMMMDREVIDYLHDIYVRQDTTERIQILSGYRSRQTNEMLRKRSSGVAKNSMHILGRAIDFRIPGKPTRNLQQTALKLARGGIGYYKRSDFVHIDTGEIRSWE